MKNKFDNRNFADLGLENLNSRRSISFKHHHGWNHGTKKLVWLVVFLVLFILLIGFGVREVKNYSAHVQQGGPVVQQEREQHDQEHQFIEHISNPAIAAYRKNYQVLPSVVIAQAIVESDWGSSDLYRNANNPFGIKGQYRHKSVSYNTAEYVHGRRVTVKAKFRKYPNLGAAIMDHDRALNKGFIHKNHVISYVTDANLLQKNHYATDPNYAKKLIRVIKLYRLSRYDLKALND